MELLLSFVVEVLFELAFEGLGWALGRRWGRIVLGVSFGFGGGLLFGAYVFDGVPWIVTTLVLVQAACIPLAGRRRAALVDLTVVGGAVAAGRWVGWAVASAA